MVREPNGRGCTRLVRILVVYLNSQGSTGAHARQLSRLRLKSLSILKAENQWRSWAIWQYGTVPQANFQPLAWVTYARYDPAVKDKQSLHDMKRLFALYGEVVPYVYHQCDWLEVGLRGQSVLPGWPTSPSISRLSIRKLFWRKRESCRACTPVEP